MESKVGLAAFLPLRIGVGQFVLTQALNQIAAGWLVQPLFVQHLRDTNQGTATIPFLHRMTEHITAHAQLYGIATCTAQLVAGLLFCVGLLHRVTAWLALLGFLCAGTLTGKHFFDSATILLLLALMSLALVPAGRVLGIDALLARRFPAWPG